MEINKGLICFLFIQIFLFAGFSCSNDKKEVPPLTEEERFLEEVKPFLGSKSNRELGLKKMVDDIGFGQSFGTSFWDNLKWDIWPLWDNTGIVVLNSPDQILTDEVIKELLAASEPEWEVSPSGDTKRYFVKNQKAFLTSNDSNFQNWAWVISKNGAYPYPQNGKYTGPTIWLNVYTSDRKDGRYICAWY